MINKGLEMNQTNKQQIANPITLIPQHYYKIFFLST